MRWSLAPIAGPCTFEQWEHYLGALEYKFTTEDEALVDCAARTWIYWSEIR